MGELGKIKPGYHEGDPAQILTIPVEVFWANGTGALKVVSIYEDEGVLCIDIEEKEE